MSRELIEPMEFFKVDKIVDDVYVIAQNVLLRFNVSLSKISGGKRYHFHKEYEYTSTKNIENHDGQLVTIKRSFDYYLSIENMQKNANGEKLFIRIGPQEIMLLRRAIDEVVTWFTDQKYSKLFAMDRGNLIITNPIPSTAVRNLPMGSYIEFVPVILDKGQAVADKRPGIRITFNNPSNFVDIDLDRFMGLQYILSCFNMYEAALAIVNYLQRPEFGTNRYVMENTYGSNSKPAGVRKANDNINGRYVNPSINDIDNS